MKERLREARQNMQSRFPLSEQLWLEWLEDEDTEDESPEALSKLRELFELALNDYLSISIWLRYLQMTLTRDPEVLSQSEIGVSSARRLCERALHAGGLHWSQGTQLWSAYIGFEQVLYSMSIKRSQDQEDRIRRLYLRQLEIPFKTTQAVFDEYCGWETEVDSSWEPSTELQRLLTKVKKQCNLRCPYEEAIEGNKPADTVLLASYLSYIQVEESTGNAERVALLYERALAIFPVTHFLWLKYCKYVSSNNSLRHDAERVYKRALRNCPWVGQLWKLYYLYISCNREENDRRAELDRIYNAAIDAHLQNQDDFIEVIMAQLASLRAEGKWTTLRQVASDAIATLSTYHPHNTDPDGRIAGLLLAALRQAGSDEDSTKDTIEMLLSTHVARHVQTWVSILDHTKFSGEVGCVRELLKRGVNRRFSEEGNGTSVLCKYWLTFEEEYGSRDGKDYMAAYNIVEPILAKIQVEMTDAQEAAAAVATVGSAPKLNSEDAKFLRRQNDPNYSRKRDRDIGTSRGSSPTTHKKMKDRKEKKASSIMEGAAEPAKTEKERRPSRPPQFLKKKGPKTAFVKHLWADANEQSLRDLFTEYGQVVALKMERHPDTGEHRGHAYVMFEDELLMKKACDGLNGKEIKGKVLFVAPSNPPEIKEKGATKHSAAPRSHQKMRIPVHEGKKHLDTPTAFVPRAVASAYKAVPPQTNEDFRKTLLSKR